MTAHLYYNTQNAESKCNWVMRCLLKGWPNSLPYYRKEDMPLETSHFWGFIENNEEAVNTLKKHKKDWYFWDMPYYGRWNGLKEAVNPDQDFYWRVSKNSVHYKHTKDYPRDRFNKWKVEPKPYGTGSKILICPSSETMTRWVTGMDVKMWVQMITLGLRKHTDRPIEVRYKPRGKGTSGPAAALIPFAEQAQDAHCVVTSISLCAFEAQLLGIPTICHPDSFASDISSMRLDEIENPKRVDTQQWFNNLAYSQFTQDEIASGLAYEILHA